MEIDYKEKYMLAMERAKNFIENGDERERTIAESIFAGIMEESEDERIRKALMQNLKERFGTKGNMGKGLDMPDVLAWLEKQGEQKSPAWSEEDKKIWLETIKLLETVNHPNRIHSNGKPLDFTKNINWLKTLRPQSHWKPSENELEVLKLSAEKDGTCLMGLYEQLKRLREE